MISHPHRPAAAGLLVLALLAGTAAAQDVTPPGTITDLAAVWVPGDDQNGDGHPDWYTAQLSWTSPGDDGYLAGTSVTSYEFRGLASPISAGNWMNTSTLDPENFVILPAPQPAAAHMNYFWYPGATYYFALIATDDANNSTPISQVGLTVPVVPKENDGGKSPCAKSTSGMGASGALLAVLALIARRT